MIPAIEYYNYLEDDERGHPHENNDCLALVPYIAPPRRKSPLSFIPLPSPEHSHRNPPLTTDVVPRILSYCDARTLSRASVACRSWYIMANRDELWNRLCRFHFGVEAEQLRPKPDPTRTLYVMSYRKMRAVVRCGRDRAGGGRVAVVDGRVWRGVVSSV
ncbi:hypothetical protein ACHAW6_010984 [Cyclotella cf. meneghiniana]